MRRLSNEYEDVERHVDDRRDGCARKVYGVREIERRDAHDARAPPAMRPGRRVVRRLRRSRAGIGELLRGARPRGSRQSPHVVLRRRQTDGRRRRRRHPPAAVRRARRCPPLPLQGLRRAKGHRGPTGVRGVRNAGSEINRIGGSHLVQSRRRSFNGRGDGVRGRERGRRRARPPRRRDGHRRERVLQGGVRFSHRASIRSVYAGGASCGSKGRVAGV
mmetsp:Transcript_5529/g.24875  ORF Transcript_5529/g.24875 Transcript_5529/m.24875 type:complete len:218 (-) Transcript_5529:1584-2237(-)